MAKYFIIAIFFISLDRFLKIFALGYLMKPINLIGEIFKLNLAKNINIAFSIPFSGPILNIFIMAIIAILVYTILVLAKKQEFTQAGYLTIIEFGAISNMYDRFRYGFVIDYFDLKYYTVFNIADSMIVIGSILLVVNLYKKEKCLVQIKQDI